MGTLAAALKDEITRLARKEIKQEVASIKKSSAQHRREIAELKRINAAAEKRIKFLESAERKRVKTAPLPDVNEDIRFSGSWVKAHRKKLGLSAADYGKLAGVFQLTIYNWESGKSRPNKKGLASWAAIRHLKKREAQKRLELLGD